MTVGWLHASSGASGDMLLGALVGAGVALEVLEAAVDAVAPERVDLWVQRVERAGLAATRVHVECAESSTRRTWSDVRTLLEGATLDDAVRARALSVFGRLAAAEGRVHGVDPGEVHFHEVGALDAIADVVGVCAGFAALGLDRLVVSPIALGGGSVQAAHGRLPVPGPAVVELLAGAPTYGGPVDRELTTPTGAVLLVELADAFGPQPPMRVHAQGFGAGGQDLAGHPNVLRLLLGEPVSVGPDALDGSGELEHALVLEANVDDLDPRLWPAVLEKLLAAGAADAWLTPILMKKGRPAHTLSVLVRPALADDVRRIIFTETSSIGVREHAVAKHPLQRRVETVDVDGQPVRVKLALLDGAVVNAQPEYADVAAAAAALGRPLKAVLAAAVAAAAPLPTTAARPAAE